MDLYRYAYTEWSDQKVKEEELDEIIAAETLGMFENGRLVSSLRIHSFQQSVRGVLKDCGGIAGVATYPEARRKGYIRKLMHEGFRLMYKQGQSVSMLDPFKQTFYSQFGYVATTAPYIVEAPLETLRYKKSNNNEGWNYERLRAVDAKERFLGFIRDVGPRQYHGYVIFKAIPDGMWKQRVKDSLVVFITHQGKIQAASRYRIKGERIKGRWQSKITVIEMLWRNREAQDRLFEFFSKHYDQIHNIVFHAPFEVRVEHWFENVRLSVTRKTPWMVRLIDVTKAVDNLPGGIEGEIVVELSDADCPWNNRLFLIRSEQNRLQMTKTSKKAAVKASIEAFSSLVFGAVDIAELEFQGGIAIYKEEVRPILQNWFPPIPLYNVVYF
jgi:predicted acetyltransferase